MSSRCHLDSATSQTARAIKDDRASFCFRTIPILKRAPLMKRPYHFPNVWQLVTYCLALSKPTTDSHEYSCPAS